MKRIGKWTLVLLFLSGCSAGMSPKESMSQDPGTPMPVMGREERSREASPAAPRVREYFPETLLFTPRLITDSEGAAELPVTMADSITTWRLTASANTREGQLGGTTAQIKVFQDFFVDVDFPAVLTQNDEVSVPVAIYNYLPGPQRVRLVATREPWFELLDRPEKTAAVGAGEVGVCFFRIKALAIGHHRLTVTAYGTSMSDAVRRQVEIVPDGQRIETAVNGRLSGNAVHEIRIPESAIPGSAKILVKCSPGVGAMLLDGMEGMLSLPAG